MSESSLAIDGEVTQSESAQLAYQVGEYIVYTQSKILLKNNEEVTIEPKVFEVLLYLCRHSSRYVLLTELHDNVWQGRIVSDAAVRRAISKLRNLLGENTAQPYIKSQHKRGYKLECIVVKISNANPDSIMPSQNAGAVNAKSTPIFKLSDTLIKKMIIIASLLIALLLFYFYSLKTSSTEPKRLIDFPGEKIHLTATKDGELVAFAGKVFDFQGYQLFVGGVGEPKVRQLTDNANNVVRVAFGPDGNQLYFVDMELGRSQLKRTKIDPSKPDAHDVLIDNFYIISDLAPSRDGRGVFFCGMREKGLGGQVYYYDLTTKQTHSVTSKWANDAHDYRIALSNDGAMLAVATTKGLEREQKVTIYNTNNFSIHKRFLHDGQIYNIVFHPNNDLIVLDSDNLIQFDLSNGTSKLIDFDDLNRVVDFDVLESNELILIKEERQDNIYIEMSLPSFNMNSQQLITKANSDIKQIVFSNHENEFYVVKALDSKHQLALQTQERKAQKILLETTMDIHIVDASSNGQHILMYLDGLLAILNTTTSQIHYVSNGSEQVYQDAAFSFDQKNVLYGLKVDGRWSIYSYDLDSGESSQLIVGFKSMRQLAHGNLLVNDSGHLHYQTQGGAEVVPMNTSLTMNVDSQWHAIGNYVYWDEFDGKNIKFHAYHLPSHQLTTQQFNKSLIKQPFDVSLDGKKALMIRRSLPKTNILQLPFPER